MHLIKTIMIPNGKVKVKATSALPISCIYINDKSPSRSLGGVYTFAGDPRRAQRPFTKSSNELGVVDGALFSGGWPLPPSWPPSLL